jgi:hypothetical protein
MLAACVAAAFAAQGCGCDPGGSSVAAKSSNALASDLAAPRLLAAGITHVFFTETDGSVHAASKRDGSVALVSSSAGVPVVGLAAAEELAVWATSDSIFVGNQDAPPIRVVTGLAGVIAVATDGNDIYWAEGPTGSVAGVPWGGGATFTLVTGDKLDGGLAVDAGTVYWGAGGVLFSGVAHGSSPTPVATGNGPIVAIAIAAQNVAWIEGKGAPLSLHLPSASAQTGDVTPSLRQLAATSRGVYAFDTSEALRLVPWDGTPATIVASSQMAVGGLAAGDSTVYFTVPNAGEIAQVVQ